MIGRPKYSKTKRKFRLRRPPGGSQQEQGATRIWRDYIELILTWEERCRLGRLYGSGTIKRRDNDGNHP